MRLSTIAHNVIDYPSKKFVEKILPLLHAFPARIEIAETEGLWCGIRVGSIVVHFQACLAECFIIQ